MWPGTTARPKGRQHFVHHRDGCGRGRRLHRDAQIERIGRFDRLGSLINPWRKNGDNDTLLPIIRGTIAERLFRTVKRRE